MELMNRVYKNLYYRGLVDNGFLYLLIIMVASLIGGIFLDLTLGLPTYTPYIIFGVATIAFGLYYSNCIKKLKEYAVDSDEWARYYTQKIVFYLDSSIQTRVPTEKKKNKNEALKQTKKLIAAIDSYWKIGNFKLSRDYFGNAIISLSSNLRNVIMPIIKGDNKDLIEKANLALIHFSKKCRSTFTIEDIKGVNKEIESIPFDRVKETLKSKTMLSLSNQRIHFIWISMLGVICFFVGVFLSYFGFSKDAVLVATITLFGILVTCYLALRGIRS